MLKLKYGVKTRDLGSLVANMKYTIKDVPLFVSVKNRLLDVVRKVSFTRFRSDILCGIIVRLLCGKLN